MLSKFLELTGLGLIAWGLALYLGPAAGIIFAGVGLVFVGSVTDDAAVGMALRRGLGWVRYGWHRQLLRENSRNGEGPPSSPHPPLRIDPEAEAMAQRMARARKERAKVHDRTPALSRYEPEEEEQEF